MQAKWSPVPRILWSAAASEARRRFSLLCLNRFQPLTSQSGVALRLPPHSIVQPQNEWSLTKGRSIWDEIGSSHSMNAENSRRLFLGSFLTLVAAGMGFSARAAVLGSWGAEYGFTQAELGVITGFGLT